MADDSRVQQLLDEILDTGSTPEAVCGDSPELLTEVRQRWQQMCLLEAELDALFPTPGVAPDIKSPRPWQMGAELPQIPGYDVQALLGRGGMGLVYKARHLRLNRFVALKMLITGAYAAAHERARFQREAEAVASLRHANIVSVYDVGEHEGRPYFTMELLEGGSLAQTLAGTPQPASHVAAFVTTVAEAVEVAHQAGIVHRDLKPANILLTEKGTPKVVDFGLARHFEGDPALTLSGVRLGTPSYMAPEQAIGEAGAIGPAADIYSLGALLYEMLTGRPPFRGETAAETERQVLAEEPVPPARLNPKVPRDLETICLKCLHKDPGRRYATAANLAEDLRRFQRGEPIAARRAGLLERSAKWVHRRPALTAMVAASLLLMLVLIGASLWLAVQQAHRRDSVDAELRDAAGLQESSRWAEARASLDRADRLDESWPHALRGRIAQARRDLDLMIKLDTIRLRRVTRGELVFYRTQSDREYRDAFPEARLGAVGDPPQRVAARINASAVRSALVAALLDWAVCASDHEQRAWLLDVVRRTESDPDDWRRRALDPSTWEKPEALDALAQSAPAAGQSVSLLLALGERLKILGADSVPLLRRVQKANPADFWANLTLGNAVLQRLPQEAAGYYRAALASRPGTAVGYCAVGDALRLQNAIGDAIDYYKNALQLDPDYSRAHSDLGLALQAQDRLDQAIDCYRKALQCDPDYGWAHYNLANALRVQGRIDEAYDHYRQVIRVDPKNSEVQLRLASILVPQGRGPEAQAGWRSALEDNPHGYAAWSGYAELCLFLGQEDEYRRARGALLDRFGATTDAYVAEPVGRACLLGPGTEDELQKSVALTDRALAAQQSTPDWIYRYFRFAHGLAEYRRGRLESAIAVMEGEASQVMGPSPRLVIAMAQYGQGQPARARKTLATAIIAFDWSAAQADTRDIWICHILRREAEAKMLPSLPKFLRGEYEPLENDERLGLVGACQSRGLYHAAARLYADAFAADPDLADRMSAAYRTWATVEDKRSVGRLEELTTEGRYLAARCAALAGCGLGADGAKLDEAQRSRWRRQASDWLRAELAVCATTLDSGPPAVRAQVRKMLAKWRLDPDLAGIRESNALDQLPTDERKEYLALWQAVGELLGRARADQ